MSIQQNIYKLRVGAKLSQEEFASLFEVSRQAVQKWENGTSRPDIEKIIDISKYFGISIDALILDRTTREKEEMSFNKKLRPKFANIHDWEAYSSKTSMVAEYKQSLDEGLDIEIYKDLFEAIMKMPAGNNREKISEVLFDILLNAPRRKGYRYNEPSELAEIRKLRKEYSFAARDVDEEELERKIHGAWMGRVCGCLLGKPIEGIRTDELVSFLKETNNYPMHRYIMDRDITDEICNKYRFRLRGLCYGDVVNGMPADDDTNYLVMAQELIEKYGHKFTAYDVSRMWLDYQPKMAYCTAERVAYCNFVNGFEPPESAVYKNPYREWIGAQIRGDYFGYINPGNPEKAAEMAFRDASISHVKNGIYGEMFIAAALACAAVTDNMEDIIRGGLAQIPHTSRIYEAVSEVLEDYKRDVSCADCFKNIHERFDEHQEYDWCHTIPNAMIVTAALLYGQGDYTKSICMAVETGFDTDCNGATVGSIIGMVYGIDAIGEEWKKPVNDTLETTLFGVGTVSISDRAKKTMKHLL